MSKRCFPDKNARSNQPDRDTSFRPHIKPHPAKYMTTEQVIAIPAGVPTRRCNNYSNLETQEAVEKVRTAMPDGGQPVGFFYSTADPVYRQNPRNVGKATIRNPITEPGTLPFRSTARGDTSASINYD